MTRTWGGDSEVESGVSLDQQIIRYLKSVRQPASIRRTAASTRWLSQQDERFLASIRRLVEGTSEDKSLPRIKLVGRKQDKIEICEK